MNVEDIASRSTVVLKTQYIQHKWKDNFRGSCYPR